MNLFRRTLFTAGLLFIGILQAFASPKPKPDQPSRLLLSIPISEKIIPARLMEVKVGEPTVTFTSNHTLTITEAGTSRETTGFETTKLTAPPSTGTYVWSGAVSKQWHDPANWLVNNIVATGIPTFGSTIGNAVQIPVVVSGNYPEITTSAGARSITIAAAASLTIKSGGQIRISGTVDNGVTNAGTFTNNGTVTLDSIYTDGFINQAGASLVNTATFTVGSGFGSRLKNSGNINNSGTFTVNGGIERGLINYSGGVVINTNVFNVQGGNMGGVYNQGKVDNSGQMQVNGGRDEITFNNLDTLINRAGATMGIKSGQKRLLDNQKYLLNEGTFEVSNTLFEGVLNRQGAKLLNKANGSFTVKNSTKTNFINAGYVENNNLFTVQSSADTAVYNKTTGEILNNGNWTAQNVTYLSWVNLGKLTLGSSAQLNINSSPINGLTNNGLILSTTGCQIRLKSFGGIPSSTASILNESNGVFENNCATSFQNINVYCIHNKGRYTQLNGSISSIATTHFLKNENYFHLNAPVIQLENTNKVFDNTDTLILGSQVSYYFQYIGSIFSNSGYLYSDAQFTLFGTGEVLNNSGKVVLGPQSILKGYQVNNAAVNSGHFTNEGVLQFTKSGPYVVNNTGTFINKNRIKSARTDYCVYNNGGTFENSGTIEVDTVGNAGIMQVGSGSSFTNTATGKIMVDMSSTGGISNAAGTFINNGELLLAQTDSLRNSAINNAAIFQNNNLIRIGRAGDNGIINTGTFTNADNGNIFITATTKTLAITPAKGIDNQSGTFTNQLCATIESNTKIITSGGSFTNTGTIKKPEDKVNGDSNISSNTGIINNLDANAFNVTGSNTPLVVAINSAATPMCQGTTRVLTATPAGGTFSVTGPGSLAGNVLTVTGGGVVNITYTNCSFTATQSITTYSTPTATVSGTIAVCQNAPSPVVTFTGSNGKAPYVFTYQINGGGNQTASTTGVNTSATVSQSGTTNGLFTYTLVSVSDDNGCSQTQSGSAAIVIQAKPTVTLSVNGQTFNEGNNQVLCDTDTNPANSLVFTATTSCLAGPVQWRTQIGAGAWSAWSSTAPSSQPSNNIAYRYQAACGDNCISTFTNPIEVTINYRATAPQNVSLTADGTTVAAGQSATVCNAAGSTITFNATCGTGEILLYSVDGGDYSAVVPTQITDGNFHNYRVRCRKADTTPSCAETESANMSLKITAPSGIPTASISPANGCGTPTAFSGNTSCGALTAVWYNAATNQALPTLPTTTPNATTSFYARCQNEAGCLSEMSNTVTFTLTPVNNAPLVSASSESVCTGTEVTLTATCPEGTNVQWNNTLTQNPLKVTFNNVTTQTYTARCIAANGCQSPLSTPKTILWKAFELTFINVGQSRSAIKPTNDRNLWTSQFITADAGPVLEKSTEGNPTIFYSENINKTAPRYWTIQVEACALGTNGSLTYDLLASPELGVIRSYNTHENNAPYLMYANREGFTELYAQNHPLYGFFADNGSGGNVYDEGFPKGLYKLGVRYWDQKGQGSIYPSTRQPVGNVLAYQEYWFRIQSQNGVGTGAARVAADNGQRTMDNGAFARVIPNPAANTLHLNVDEAKGQKVSATMSDAFGRALLQRTFVPETNQHQEEFDVSHLSNGMYFLRVNTAEKQATLKVIKVGK